MKNKTKKHTILLPAVAATVAVFSLAALFAEVVAQDTENLLRPLGDNETSTDSSINMTSSTRLILNNGTLDCQAIATELGGIGVPSGNVCDVVVVRQDPQVTGHSTLNLNQFTLMNSVLEFVVMPANATTSSGNSTTTASEQVYVMGDFALLETEMNDVLSVVKENGWTVTGIHNHMINETPKTTFMHWEAQGNINEIVDQANEAFAETSIKG
ncbi:MAG TPA: DUF1259 domain-containing protein [Nitrososphaeraceae archaeon]|nr:DUF1259 domain-containing protein [Nitrososphaeraceae archaeon]